MKRQISILACLLMLVAIVFAVASCTQPEAAHVHEYVESVTKEATCTEKGELTYTCSCGDTYVNETSVKEHEITLLAAVEPTCTTEGKTSGKACVNCGLVIEAQSTVAPLGHELGAPATCTEPQACARGCGKVFVEALGHKANDATCTEASVCSVCKIELKAALGHKPTDATCTEPSICTVCKEEQAPALGHTLAFGMECCSAWCDRCGNEWVEATKEHEYNCDCDLFCKNCYEFTRPEATHSMIYVEAKAPTCTELGNTEYWYCEYCLGVWDNQLCEGWMLNMMVVKIPMVDHEYFYACDAHCMNCNTLTNEEAAHSLVHVEAVAPTCTENGNVEYWYCEHCGTCWDNENGTGVHLNRMNVIAPALGHKYNNKCDGWCSTCYEFTNPEAAHSLKHVAAVAPTCTENGNVEHWECEYCGGCWDNDKAMYAPLNQMRIIDPAPGHTYALKCDPVCLVCQYINTEAAHDVVHVAAVAPTCTEDGNIEYWHCSYCELHWVNEDCTINTSASSVVIPDLGGHKGHDYDLRCDTCKLYLLPEAGVALKLGMYVNPKNDTYYITGSLSGYYLATTTNIYTSPDFFLEKANDDGGFYLYFMSGTTKKYLSVQASGSYNNPKVGSTKGLFTLDAKTGALVTKTSNGNVYLGTYSTYTTVGASYISYITGNNVGNVDKSQHLLRMEILEPHDCQMSEATCTKASTCSICGKVEGSKLPHTPGAEATCTAAQKCTVCGTTIKAALPHTGGTATCTEKAVCGTCGQSYGNLAAHTGGTATCVDKAVCGTCGQSYGNLAAHNYVDGVCSVCTAKEPTTQTFTADFSTVAANTSYTSRKTTSGWTGTNCAVMSGGSSDSNPTFKVIGASTNRAFTMNGKTSAKGKIVSPTLSNGISKITFKYTNFFSESNGVDITINIKQNGTVVATQRLDNNSVTKLTAYTFTWENIGVNGDFTIEIVNNSPSNSTSNKDRVGIWDLQWTTNN